MSDTNKSITRELRDLIKENLVKISELSTRVEVFTTGVADIVKDLDKVHLMLGESLRRETELGDRIRTVESRTQNIDEVVRLEVDKRLASRT